MLISDGFGNGKAKSIAAGHSFVSSGIGAGSGSINSVKSLEDMGERLRRNRFSHVVNGQQDFGIGRGRATQRDGDRTSRQRVLCGVVKQDHDQLLELRSVAHCKKVGVDLRIDRDASLKSQRLERQQAVWAWQVVSRKAQRRPALR